MDVLTFSVMNLMRQRLSDHNFSLISLTRTWLHGKDNGNIHVPLPNDSLKTFKFSNLLVGWKLANMASSVAMQ